MPGDRGGPHVAFHGIPIVTPYDADTYNWDADVVKWLGEYGDFFYFQVVERKRSHLESGETLGALERHGTA